MLHTEIVQKLCRILLCKVKERVYQRSMQTHAEHHEFTKQFHCLRRLQTLNARFLLCYHQNKTHEKPHLPCFFYNRMQEQNALLKQKLLSFKCFRLTMYH